MKKKILFAFLVFFTQVTISQNLFFSKKNYSDSTLFEKNIHLLAQQVITKYQEANLSEYYDNLFRIQIIAKQYNVVENTLAKYSMIIFGDSVSNPLIGFPYKIYSRTMIQHPFTKDVFRKTFQPVFESAYKLMDDRNQIGLMSYYVNDLKKFKTDLDSFHLNTDSISVKSAVSLCRAYCSYIVYSSTQALATEIFAKIDEEKYIQDDSVLVRMPDGGSIALTIVRDKKTTSPQPVILMYNIYAGYDPIYCKEAVQKGYIGIVANTRGKRLSPEVIEPFEHDAADAYNIIDWISKQSWCNGKVGMYGGSYLGFSQWSAVKHLHPALKTIVPQVSVGVGIDYPAQNGVFMSYMLRWIHYVTNNKLTDETEFGDSKKWENTYIDWYKKGNSFRSLDTLEGRPNAIFQRWLKHPSYDTYWQNMTPQKEEFSKISIPILTTTGYYDDDQLGAMYYYNQYQKWNKSNNYYLLIGPYSHSGAQGYPSPELAGYKIDSVANISIQDIVFQWFNYTLKDSMLPEILKDKVNFEVMGANEWKHVPTLEKMHNDSLIFYLGNSFDGKNYSLLTSKPKIVTSITQKIDLKDRTEINIRKDDYAIAFPKIIDSILIPEKNKLVFISEPIDKPFAISGAFSASIIASINKKDMDIVIDLYEETSDGKFFALCENLQRASLAKDASKRQLLQPNTKETIELTNNFITSKQLKKGSRIIILVGVNKAPDWQINYGSGKDVSDETINDAGASLEVKWFNSSYIKLPILK